MLTGGFELSSSCRRTASSCPGCRRSDRRIGKRRASCPACGRPAACISAISSARSATGCRCRTQYDCFYFVADWHALTSDFADTSQLTVVRLRQRRRLDRRRARSREEHVLHPVAGARARRAVPAAVDGRAGAVARARADLQGAAGEPEGQGSVVDRLPRLSAAADRRRRDVRRAASCRSARIRSRTSSWRARSVRRFNNFFGDVLVEPQPLLTTFGAAARPRRRQEDEQEPRQHDSPVGHADDVKKKVRQMYTDPKRVRADIPGTVEGNPVFIYHDAFNPNTAEVDDLKARYRAGKVGDVEVKTKLANALNAHLEPIRERRAAVLAKPGSPERDPVRGIAARARRSPPETMERVRDAMKICVPMMTDDRRSRLRVGARRLPGQARRTSRGRSICCCTSSRRTRSTSTTSRSR